MFISATESVLIIHRFYDRCSVHISGVWGVQNRSENSGLHIYCSDIYAQTTQNSHAHKIAGTFEPGIRLRVDFISSVQPITD